MHLRKDSTDFHFTLVYFIPVQWYCGTSPLFVASEAFSTKYNRHQLIALKVRLRLQHLTVTITNRDGNFTNSRCQPPCRPSL